MDVDQYLARIDVDKPIGVDLVSLEMLQLAHLKAVPFENLDIHYSTHISLSEQKFFEKVVVNKRGGFCYELNGLFHRLLQDVGFNAKIVSARVARNGGGFTPEYDHLAIVVSIDGLEYLVDVGFGHFSSVPLQIHSNVAISDGRDKFRIREISDNYFQVSRMEDEVSIAEYAFTMTGRDLSEFHDMCEFHQKSSDSHFRRKKLISILTNDGRITLTDTQLKISGVHGAEVEEFESSQFESYLEKYFGIRIPINHK